MNIFGKARNCQLKIINKEMLIGRQGTPKMVKIPSNPKLESELRNFFIRKKKTKLNRTEIID